MTKANPKLIAEMQLYDSRGSRLYLNNIERQDFLKATEQYPQTIRTLCMTLCLTGCRISEALNLIIASVDLKNKTIIFETFKQRQRTIFRTMPVPDPLLNTLDLVHDLGRAQRNPDRIQHLLWDMPRQIAHDRIKAVMRSAGIRGKHATPKGLRHSFGVHAVNRGIPLTILQQWMGHEHISTTAVYGDAIKNDIREIAKRMW